MIRVEVDVKGLLEGLSDLEKRQLPFATMTALNLTVEELQAAIRHEMRDSFAGGPTPYTLRGVRVRRATRQELSAEVALQDTGKHPNRPTRFLRPEIEGGPRSMKGYEKLLGRRYTVPGRELRLDRYGNIPGGQIARLLSDAGLLRGGVMKRTLQEEMDADARAKARREKRGRTGKAVYFVGRPGGGRLPEGVWERRRIGRYSVVRPVLIFLDRAPVYEPRLEWDFTARLIWKRHYPVNFQQALAYAMATRRQG